MGIYNAHAFIFLEETIMAMNIVQLFISVLLYFVLFYGISFILNMILKMTWLMAYVYPVIVLWIIGRVSLFDYISEPGERSEERRVGKECCWRCVGLVV